MLFHFGVLFNSSLRVKDCHLIPVGDNSCIWSFRPRCYCLLDLVAITISCLLFYFRFSVPFQICCSISYFVVPFLIYRSISCPFLFWCEEWSRSIVSNDIYYLAPRSRICSLIYLSSISLQRDELLLLDPWLINCLAFWMCGWIF